MSDGVLGGVLHRPIEADGDRRRGLPRHLVEHVDVDAVLVDADHPPAGLPVELVDHRLLDLADDVGREPVVGGQQLGLRRDDHARAGADRRGHPVVVRLAQRDQPQRLLRRARLLGQPLRVHGVVERPQRVDDGRCGRHQFAAGRLGVQRVVVQIAGHQHVAAAALVDRRPRRRVGAQRKRLVLTEFRMQPGRAPADLPAALVADHVQLAVVGPGAVLGQVPGVAVGDAAGVLGVFRAQDLGVQPGGLQPGPRLVERGPGVLGAVAQLRCSGGVTGGQRREEFFCRRFGPIGFRCAGAERGDGSDNCGDRQQAARPRY